MYLGNLENPTIGLPDSLNKKIHPMCDIEIMEKEIIKAISKLIPETSGTTINFSQMSKNQLHTGNEKLAALGNWL